MVAQPRAVAPVLLTRHVMGVSATNYVIDRPVGGILSSRRVRFPGSDNAIAKV
jgi:hypothetical protein